MQAPPAADVPLPPTRWMPPRWLLLFAGAAGALHLGLPQPVVARSGLAALLVAALAVGLMAWAMRVFSAVGTTIKPTERTTALATTGPFARSRNPIYLAMVLLLVAEALALGTPSAWLAPPAFLLFVTLRFVRHEERALEVAMGEPYRAYRKRVRRWL